MITPRMMSAIRMKSGVTPYQNGWAGIVFDHRGTKVSYVRPGPGYAFAGTVPEAAETPYPYETAEQAAEAARELIMLRAMLQGAA